MNKYITDRHVIVSLPEWMLRIICIALTIIYTSEEASGQPHLPFHYDIIQTKPSPNYNSRIHYMIIDSKDEQEYTKKSPIDHIPYAHYVISRTKNNFGQILIHQIIPEN